MFLQHQCTFLPWQFTVLTLFLSISTGFFLLRTAMSDPGIVSKRHAAPGASSRPKDEEEMAHLVDDNSQEAIDPTSCDFGCHRRFCDICELAQAPGTIHCEDCDVCIQDHDHHCPWMGKCIGKKNMASFRVFNLCWVVYLLFVLFTCLFTLDGAGLTGPKYAQANPLQQQKPIQVDVVVDPTTGNSVNITTLRGAKKITVIKTEIIYTSPHTPDQQQQDQQETLVHTHGSMASRLRQ